MALFREHITFGAVIAAIGTTLIYFYAIITDPVLLGIIFVVTIIGSFLPDIDSDTGVPFYAVFGIFTLVCGACALYYTLEHYPGNWYVIVGVPIATLAFVWGVVGTIFKRYTRHRGIMHSIPVMGIAGLSTLLIVRYLGQGDMVAFACAAAVAVGFASHLILDEIHSENVLDGNPFTHKQSVGTALKLFSHSGGVNLFTYILLVTLLYTALH